MFVLHLDHHHFKQHDAMCFVWAMPPVGQLQSQDINNGLACLEGQFYE
jgi:hypothetical protein